MDLLLFAFVLLLVCKTGVELVLDLLNRRRALRSGGTVPELFFGFIDQETFEKSIDYTVAKSRFSSFQVIYDAVLLLAVVVSGVLPMLYTAFLSALGSGIWAHALIVLLIVTLYTACSLPLEWWMTFRLEERFGFNRSTTRLWWMDKLKSFLISGFIGVPLICFLLWLVRFPGWWLMAFVAVTGFQFLMIIVYPMFIMPLFNKFVPLPEGELRSRLLELADRTGFRARTILIMDGSRRSTHSNAFFTGFGRFRRIVLFDTLAEQMNGAEMEAVLAHEIGHYKLGHVPKTLLVSALFTFLGFWLLGLLVQSPRFYAAFGFSQLLGLGPALLLFALLSGLLAFWLSPVLNQWSRRREYAADAFSRDAVKSAKPLVQALRKLHEKNLSNLAPHPAYSRFYYSHPTLLEREAALKT